MSLDGSPAARLAAPASSCTTIPTRISVGVMPRAVRTEEPGPWVGPPPASALGPGSPVPAPPAEPGAGPPTYVCEVVVPDEAVEPVGPPPTTGSCGAPKPSCDVGAAAPLPSAA